MSKLKIFFKKRRKIVSCSIMFLHIEASLALALAVGGIPKTLARPSEHQVANFLPTLEITSNLEPEIPYEDGIGPFVIGKELTITCSSGSSQNLSLSWWEGKKQLPTLANAGEGFVITSYVVGTLQKEDSLRYFTCRELLSGAEKSVDLQLVDENMVIEKDGQLVEDRKTVEWLAGTNISINCIVRGSRPSTGSWWEGKTKLQATRTATPDAITSELLLPPASDEDNGRTLTCRARNGQLVKTVVLSVAKDIGASLSPSETPKTATTSPSETPKTATTTTYFIAGGAAIASIGVVVVILLLVTLKIWRRMSQQDTSTPPQRENSSEQQALTGSSSTGTSEHTTLGSLDPSDLPPEGPLLPRQPRVEGDDETSSSGDRMSAMLPNDRDHSYYYPNLINTSYYYPKITDEVRKNMMLGSSTR